MYRLVPQARADVLKEQLSDFPSDLVSSHISRLDVDYFDYFTPEQVGQHLSNIQELGPSRLCRVRFFDKGDGLAGVCVVGFDFPGLFAILSALLSVYGFNIQNGHIFTYSKFDKDDRVFAGKDYFFKRKKIIDYVEAVVESGTLMDQRMQEEFERELNKHLLLINAKKQRESTTLINQRVGKYLSALCLESGDRLLPIHIDIEQEQGFTLLRLEAEDTPAFLFSLANALAMQGISIARIVISTSGNKVSDLIYVTDKYERPITDTEYLNRLKVAIVLIKQFTLLLPFASDPDIALKQFDQFISAAVLGGEQDLNFLDLNNHATLASLARVLGTGKYLWEEFVRMQYATLLPMLNDLDELKARKNKDVLEGELDDMLCDCGDWDGKIERINAYKNRELFRIDMLYLIYPSRTFIEFSQDLCALAQVIISKVSTLVYQRVVERFGKPRTKDGRECAYGVFALGKLGSLELGYASDIEMMLVYEESGYTDRDGKERMNSEFFNTMVQYIRESIHAKQDGIFEIDLRLRPFGNKGELASVFKTWRQYYGPGGNALDYERQALLKLSPICGGKVFCTKVMQARDEIVFGSEPVPIKHTQELRLKQVCALVKPGTLNAKFSNGGLVELEYAVQFLQLMYGHTHHELRFPNIIHLLEKFLELGIITPTEFEKLYNSYAFLRRLINALRMCNGNAKDLVIPKSDSEDFMFLARRLGYVNKGSAAPAKQLEDDIADVFATVHSFYESRFVDGAKTSHLGAGLPEIVLGQESDPEVIEKVLASCNLFDVSTALAAFENMRSGVEHDNTLLAVLVLAKKYIQTSPSPEKVLINLEKFLNRRDDKNSTLQRMMFHPRQIELICLVFGYSDYLSDILINEAYLWDYISSENTLFYTKTKTQFAQEMEGYVEGIRNPELLMDRMRQYRNREVLRIGLRDIYLGVDLVSVVKEISDLTDTLFERTFRLVFDTVNKSELVNMQSIIALGKLGGRELNYSSDIDIVFVLDNDAELTTDREVFDILNNELIKFLTESSRFGKLFRVDVRLRPYGASGILSGKLDYYLKYYNEKAGGWELQAWLKARHIAGNEEISQKLISSVHALLHSPENKEKIVSSINVLRGRILHQLKKSGTLGKDVKLGPGGIRTIEFVVQRLQILNCTEHPDIISGHSLYSLFKLHDHGLICFEDFDVMSSAYRFFRTVEHRIQLLGLQQNHLIPSDEAELYKLAKRMGFENRFEESATQQFMETFKNYTTRISAIASRFWQE